MEQIKKRVVNVKPYSITTNSSEDGHFELILEGCPTNAKKDNTRVKVVLKFDNWWYKTLIEFLKIAAKAQYERALKNMSLFK